MQSLGIIVIFVLLGLFVIVCAIKDFDWFMEHRRAKIFLKLFGRSGARVFYGIIGIAIIALTVLGYINGQF